MPVDFCRHRAEISEGGGAVFFGRASPSSVKSKGNIWQANDIFSTLGYLISGSSDAACSPPSLWLLIITIINAKRRRGVVVSGVRQ